MCFDVSRDENLGGNEFPLNSFAVLVQKWFDPFSKDKKNYQFVGPIEDPQMALFDSITKAPLARYETYGG